MSKLFNLFFIFALVAALLGSSVSYTPAHAIGLIIRVTETGAAAWPCGDTWANACALQTALANANNDQIWVEAGRYIPHASDPNESFILNSGDKLYGGFAGTETETQFNLRDPIQNVTILSGDLLNNDGLNFANNSENSYHVVKAITTNNTTILDGFTIRGGYANGASPDNLGAGMYNNTNSNLKLINVTFSGNKADDSGGGMYNGSSSPTLTNVTFSENQATWGAGMYNGNGSPILENVRFERNKAVNGGGMLSTNSGSNPRLTTVTFSKNQATWGAGMYNNNSSISTLTNVTFSENTADNSGGGMINQAGSRLVLTDVTFAGNSATVNGGAMYNNNGNATLTDVTFAGNSAAWGGGMYNQTSNPTLTNVTFSENKATNGSGGGMLNQFSSKPTLKNVTFSGNTATNGSGGGMYNTNDGNPTLTNVTFFDNSATNGGGGLYNGSGTTTLINTIIANSPSGGDCINASTLNPASSNNLIEDDSNACGLTNGVNDNLIGVNPNLGPLVNEGGFTQTHALLADSPAINKGTNTGCPATDQRGVKRPQPQGGLCDIGAFEAQIFTISGNAGKAGVTLSYKDVTPKTVTSQPNGSYSLPVYNYWSGTITPTHPCYTFNPASRNHNNVPANLTGQNFSATFNPASTCAEIAVRLGTALQGTQAITKNAGARLSFPKEGGPVFVNGTNSVPFVASERVLYPKGSNNPANFSEMMGLPANLRSTKYSFPAYDNLVFDSQLRFANVGNANTTVIVTIGGVERGRYNLGPNQSTKVSYPNLSGGPVVVQSTGNVPIIASLRVVTRPYNGSFSEMIGLPQSQVGTSYVFPWYNNATLDTQLRVGNIGTGTAQVTVTVGGVAVPGGSFSLALNESKRISFANVNNGPVRVTSVGNIVASMRILPKNSTASFSEIMGLPLSQLDTTFVFPWYNNVTLDTQLRFANMSNTTATVRVFIGGQEMAGSPFTLAAGVSTRKSFAVNSGPVRIVSDRNIVASLRVLPKNSTTGFSELMGLPQHQLYTAYIFPWYNNVGLDTQLRLGVP